MKKEQIEIELNKLMEKLDVLENRSKLTWETCQFLAKEADGLLTQSKNASKKEKIQIEKQMDALYLRIEKEQEILASDMVGFATLNEQFNHLQSLAANDE